MTYQISAEALKKNLRLMVFSAILFLPFSAWALDRKDDWRNLSPKEKEEIQRNYQRWQNLPPKDKEHLREEWNRWQSLPQDRRDRLRQRYDDLHKLPPEQQRDLRDRFKGNNPRRPRERDSE